jgi:hypothetical protein
VAKKRGPSPPAINEEHEHALLQRRQAEQAAFLTEHPKYAQEPFPLGDDQFVDPEHNVWHLRGGGDVPERRLLRLLRDPAVRVINVEAWDYEEIPPDKREAFWSGAKEQEAASEYVDYFGYEYKSASGARLLLIGHNC